MDKSRLIKTISDGLNKNGIYTVAIDGGSAAGKSTLGEELREYFSAEKSYNVSLFHMDDFYLRPEQRIPERYEEPGGNVDRERFLEEVLIPLSKIGTDTSEEDSKNGNNQKGNDPKGFIIYRPLECPSLTFGESQRIYPGKLRIIEGAYSHHPDLREYYDLKVFLDIDPETQIERIKKRNTPDQQERFFDMWIPLENKYFAAFDIRNRSDLIIKVGR